MANIFQNERFLFRNEIFFVKRRNNICAAFSQSLAEGDGEDVVSWQRRLKALHNPIPKVAGKTPILRIAGKYHDATMFFYHRPPDYL